MTIGQLTHTGVGQSTHTDVGQSTHIGDDNAPTNGSHVDRLLALILGEKTILDFEASRRLGFVAVKDHAHLVRPARPFELPGAAKTLSAPSGK